MNVHLGLRRISAVVWGFLFIILYIAMVAPLFNEPGRNLVGIASTTAVILVLFLICHGVTKWVLAGFFSRDVQSGK